MCLGPGPAKIYTAPLSQEVSYCVRQPPPQGACVLLLNPTQPHLHHTYLRNFNNEFLESLRVLLERSSGKSDPLQPSSSPGRLQQL